MRAVALSAVCVDSPGRIPALRAGPLLPGSRRGLRDRRRNACRCVVGRVRRLAWSHPRAPRGAPASRLAPRPPRSAAQCVPLRCRPCASTRLVASPRSARGPCFPARAAASAIGGAMRAVASSAVCVDSPGRIPALRAGPLLPGSRRGLRDRRRNACRCVSAVCVDSPGRIPALRAGPLLPGSRRGLRDRRRNACRCVVGRVRRLAWSHPRAPRGAPASRLAPRPPRSAAQCVPLRCRPCASTRLVASPRSARGPCFPARAAASAIGGAMRAVALSAVCVDSPGRIPALRAGPLLPGSRRYACRSAVHSRSSRRGAAWPGSSASTVAQNRGEWLSSARCATSCATT